MGFPDVGHIGGLIYSAWVLVAQPPIELFTDLCLQTLKPTADTISDCTKAIEKLKGENKLELAAEALAVRSVAYEVRGDQDHAADDISEAIRLSKNERGPLLKRSFVDFESGNYQRALETLTPLVAKFPDDPELRRERAFDFYQLGKYKDSAADFVHAVRFQPQNAELYNHAAWSLLLIGQYDEGLTYADKAVQFTPNDRKCHDTRANLLSSVGRADEALREFAKSLFLGGDEDFARVAILLKKKKYLEPEAQASDRSAIIAAIKKCVADKCRLLAELN
jgi:tetratricopeptide (TPR) repeat protein